MASNAEIHSFRVNDTYQDVLLENALHQEASGENVLRIPTAEQSIHVLTFAGILGQTKDVRTAVFNTLQSCHAAPESDGNNGRISFARLSGMGIPTIMQWMLDRDIISDYVVDSEVQLASSETATPTDTDTAPPQEGGEKAA